MKTIKSIKLEALGIALGICIIATIILYITGFDKQEVGATLGLITGFAGIVICLTFLKRIWRG